MGALATFIPTQMPVLHVAKGEYVINMQLVMAGGQVQNVLDVHMPPNMQLTGNRGLGLNTYLAGF